MKKLITLLLAISLAAIATYLVVFKPVPVHGHVMAKGVVVREALGSGSIESRRMVGVGFEVTARVAEILVDQGDLVEAGQVLARLDQKTFQAEVESARQEVARAESTRLRLQADIERAKAVLQGAQDNLKRTAPLVNAGTASAERLDVAEEREKVAIAELASAKAAMTEGEAGIRVAQRKLARAEVELGRTILHSPFDGAVVLREREVGDVAVPGSPVLRLAATDTVWSSVWVDESHLAGLQVGLATRVVLRSNPNAELPGFVARIGREVDRETRELLVDIAFKEMPQDLVFGQRVDAWIELSRANDVLRLPAGLLVRRGSEQGVFVEDNSRARFQAVELGLSGRGFFEVKSGLAAGDSLLASRAAKPDLKEGDRVTLVGALDGGGEGVEGTP